VLAVKKNQKELYEYIDLLFTKSKVDTSLIFQSHQTVDSGHGRIETRKYSTIAGEELLAGIDGWDNLNAVGMVESTREVGETVSHEKRYFIMSTNGHAKDFGNAVGSVSGRGVIGQEALRP
jgi:hypothetical protein